jgi:ABC-type glutathione transport system ATPase component
MTEAVSDGPIAELVSVSRAFARSSLWRGPAVMAVRQVSLAVEPGEVLGIVGASGSGKSTLGRLLAGLLEPTEGRVCFHGNDLRSLRGADLLGLRARVQYVFQNASAALSPRRRVGASLEEPLQIQGRLDAATRQHRVERALGLVGLSPALLGRYPHELSGGQRQRAALARSLVLEPALLIADEPVASLDVSIQAQILQVLHSLRSSAGVTTVLISHDIAVINALADRVAVMHEGQIVELGPRREVLFDPRHAYTRQLLAASAALGLQR